MTNETLLLVTMLIPFAGAIGIGLTGRWPNLRETITLVSATSVMICVFMLYGRFQNGERLVIELLEPLPGLPIVFEIEALGMLFALVAGILWLATSIYAIGYMRGHKEKKPDPFLRHVRGLHRKYARHRLRR